ncbi:facilitated trehalose transporter Tret1-like [Eupeodes corollae]|uniref:facilitated trehalose transporter Tret1-like n=1 Tax=Eupeodes corollae TaxID=290404 RepID=UPI0024918D57|nr:facilitated trehalose transporter Tret1-like [Eupeodes corollae]
MYTTYHFGKYRVVFVAICANMMSFSIGAYMAWVSPVMPKLRNQSADSPLSYRVTATQEGWISSMASIGALAVPFFVGSLANTIGRKWTLLLFSSFIAVSYIFLILTNDIWFIYLARFLQGFGGGGGAGVIPMYIGEIATDDTRGALGSLMTIFVISGNLYTYIIGPHVSYLTLQYCCMAVPVLFFVIFVFMPETPYHYAIKGQDANLINSLRILRGKSDIDVEQERIKIQRDVDESMSNRSRIIDIFRNRTYRKALFITCGLLFFHEMSGANAVTLYSQSIFMSADSFLDPAFATIILGVVQLISNFITPFAIERAGRKKTLYISSVGMAVPLIALGLFFYLKETNGLNIIWLPIPALMLLKASYGFGFGPVPWALMGEMFPSNIKPNAMAIACALTWAVSFIVTRWFAELYVLGAFYVFWLFGGFCVLAFFFVKVFVIETKGLSLQKIQEKLQKPK